MRLTDIRDALASVGVPVSHYREHKQEYPYIVWGETGEVGSQTADNRKRLQRIGGFVEYLTKTEYDDTVTEIQMALVSSGAAWRLEDVSYDYDGQFIAYRWRWEGAMSLGYNSAN